MQRGVKMCKTVQFLSKLYQNCTLNQNVLSWRGLTVEYYFGLLIIHKLFFFVVL